MDIYIAVDVGGTQLRVAVYSGGETRPIKQKRIPTRQNDEEPIDRLAGLITELWPEEGTVRAIGLAVPGWVNAVQGVIVQAPNIPGWDNMPLVKLLEDRFHVPVKLGNDANMAAVGEWRFGAGQGHHDIIYMTISTGIGGGVITHDRLLLGKDGMAAELGHVTLIPDGPICSCGHCGHLEAVGSGLSIARFVTEQIAQGAATSLASLSTPTARDISAAAEQGDPLAIAALARAGKHIGHALANYITIFNPSIIILGGGVSRSGAFLFDPVREGIAEWALSPAYLQDLSVVPAALGDDAGLMGAFALACGMIE